MQFSILTVLCFLYAFVYAAPVNYRGDVVVRTESVSSHLSTLERRAPTSLKEAVCLVKKRKVGSPIGSGKTGTVYNFPGGWGADKTPAVIKVIDNATPKSVEKEIVNLKHVKQFLAWADDNTAGYASQRRQYIVIKKMGITAAEAAGVLRKAAEKHYLDTYHMTNRDTSNPANFVYVHDPTTKKWHAEIIDWEVGTYSGTGAQTAGSPETIGGSGCVIM